MTSNTPPTGHLKVSESHGSRPVAKNKSSITTVLVMLLVTGMLYIYLGEAAALAWIAICLIYPFRRLI